MSSYVSLVNFKPELYPVCITRCKTGAKHRPETFGNRHINIVSSFNDWEAKNLETK